MTNFQKAFCVFLSLCFFAVLALLPGQIIRRGNVFGQLPLYCFLEDKARSIPQSEDPETLEKIIADNGAYLGQKIREENQSAKKADNLSAQAEKESAPAKENTPAKEKVQEEEKTEQEETVPNKEDGQEPTPIPTPALTKSPEKETRKTKETEEISEVRSAAASIKPHPKLDLSLETLADYDYLLGNFFILDPNTATSAEQLNAEQFLAEDFTLDQEAEEPQILIYHSHSQETFIDSREGVEEDTIVGVGNYLTKLLTEDYGYNVIHVKEAFDMVDGELDRSAAYDYSGEYVEKVLEEYPSIQVVIDLHRDGVPEDTHLVTKINGKDTAQLMFFNGLSYTVNNGPVEYLPNPYIQENLAFSFQMEYQAALYYPDLYRGIYLAGLRYNLHLRPRAVLLEAGAQTNTVQEVKNAMEPFADILHRVLSGET